LSFPAQTATLFVSARVGVPDITPVSSLMTIPGGSPIAEKLLGTFVAVMV
jgi:hypothetical protein